ncbi:MAG TPA: tetratricopeptide repeat protein [Candidatus Angelobacter sp.]|nr:tetratricopeptide repeat protein [Candidatus Angelobacter sp.]
MSDISKKLDKAEKYLQRNKPEAALEEYLDILQEEPSNDQVRASAADLCLALGRTGEAITLLSHLLEQEAEAGDTAKGIVTFKKLAKLAVPTPLQTFFYARLIEKKDKREALEAYQTAMAGFEKQGQGSQALAAAKHVVDLAPTEENLKRAGERAATQGQGWMAAECFVQLGQMKDQESHGSGAAWYAQAYKLDPNNRQAVLYYARGLFSRNEVAECIEVLKPAVAVAKNAPEVRELYAHALMAARRPAEAEPYAWELFEKDPRQLEEIAALVGVYLDSGDSDSAIALARRIDEHESRAGRQKEFLAAIYDISERRLPALGFVDYLADLFNRANREDEYSNLLLKLFQAQVNAGHFSAAGEALDRAAELDPYEPGHVRRLEMLQGKIDDNQYNRIARRFHSTAATQVPGAPPSEDGSPNDDVETPAPAVLSAVGGQESEPTVLEDFILQAEIYLQYGMRSKAIERLERISKLFPREEAKNMKLRGLYSSAGFTPSYEKPSLSARAAEARPAKGAAAGFEENAVDNFARVTEITRNIYRQGSVKSVLFAAVNDIGRHFNASRCVAGLCTVGKPPSAALEYCAPGVKQSDVMSIVKLIGVAQQLTANGPATIAKAKTARELEPVRAMVETLGIQSLLVVPLVDAGEQTGILILEQCQPRQWQQTDIVVLRTIAEQMVLAVSNARLRTLMKSLAVTDEKSGLLRRASYLDVLLSEVKRSMQQKIPLTLILLHFGRASALVKEIGETQVEALMQQIGQTLASHIRQNDVAVRYELTTIALVLSDTNEKTSFLVVNKMRKVLASTKIPGTERTPPVTAGIAEAVLQEHFDPADIVTEVINRVENALEVARSEGGNKAHSLAANLQPSLAGWHA